MSWFTDIKNAFAYRKTTRNLRTVERLIKDHLKELEKHRSEIQPDIFDTTQFLLEEMVEAYGSIIQLLKAGRFQSSLTIGRTIVESTVNLRYIHKEDSERRAKAFIQFPTVGLLEKAKRAYREDPKPEYGKLINYLDYEKKRFKNQTGNERSWSGKNMKEMCDELGLLVVYQNWYKRLSEYSHCQYRGHRDLNQRSPYPDFLRNALFKDTPVLGLQALKTINEKYNLLEGFVVISDVPQKGAVPIFSINNNAMYKCVQCGDIPASEVRGTAMDQDGVVRSLGYHVKCGRPVVNK